MTINGHADGDEDSSCEATPHTVPEAALDDALARQDAAGRQEIIEHVKDQFAAYLEGLE